MAKKMTAREKLEKLLDETVHELSDEFRRKSRETLEYSRSLRGSLEQDLQRAKEAHREAMNEATSGYYKSLAQIVNTGLLALKLDAPPPHIVSELVTIAHSAIPPGERSDFGVPVRLAVPLDQTAIPTPQSSPAVPDVADPHINSGASEATAGPDLDLRFDPAPPQPSAEESAAEAALPATVGSEPTCPL